MNGPRGSWLTGNLPQFGADPLGFLEACARDYGDIVPLRFFNKRVYLVNRPDLIEQILTSRSRDFRKTLGYRTPFMRRLFGEGLLTSEGSFWTRQRKLAQPAFHGERIASYGCFITENAEALAKVWSKHASRPIHGDTMQLTMRVVTQSLFSADVPSEVRDLTEGSAAVMERFTTQWSGLRMLLNIFPSPGKWQFQRVVKRLDRYLFGLIAERRRTGEKKGDLLSMLLAARDEDGSGMSDRQLRDELITLMLAGLDTTALALSWGFYLLAHHPDTQEDAASQTSAVLEGRAPSVADLPRLEALQNVVKESMRLFPPAWIVGREALKPFEWQGLHFNRGDSFLMSQWITHRDPRFFSDPLEFRPQRWSAPATWAKFAYFPFGGGPRICIGHAFATMEAVLVLASLLPRFRVSCEKGYTVRPFPSITLQPRGGIELRVEPRECG